MIEFFFIFFSIFAALLFCLYLANWICKQPKGTERMQEIAQAIREGASAYIYRQYSIIALFVVLLAPLLFFFLDNGPLVAASFAAGAAASGLAGFMGMKIAVQANVRAAAAATHNLFWPLQIAFSSGAVMGLSVVSFALLGISTLYFVMTGLMDIDPDKAITIVKGFGLGSSMIALFARVGGGIFTKAADVSADLAGKIEAGIPEDDPRNPAVIADNVGDNVGDVAGMGSDLFESYVGTLIASLTIGAFTFSTLPQIIFPLLLAAAGILASILGAQFVVRGKKEENPLIHGAFKNGLFAASGVVIAAAYFLTQWTLPASFALLGATYTSMGVFYTIITGLAGGILIGLITEYYTSSANSPVQEIAREATTGAGTVIIAGLAVGFQSTIIPVIILCVVITVGYYMAGLYGIAISGVGMLSTLGVSLAVDAYGPVADNAGGIAEMAGLDKEVRQRTDALDEAGNTTAAIGKGFAVSSAMLSALALFSAFSIEANLQNTTLASPAVLVGLFLGAGLPYLFSSLTMRAVGRCAYKMISEVRRQFKTIEGIMEGTAKPDYAACVDIAATAALKEMIAPGVIAIAAPLLVGFLLGPTVLGGLLIGSLASGFLMAVMMANSGGAWDNAKKYIESGHHGGKNSEAHKAAVIGDLVGDPFKDTCGPSLNILINVMNIISLVFAPLFKMYGGLIF